MEKTTVEITLKENNNLLLSKKELNEFLEAHREDLKENNWDKIFESVNFAGDVSDYPARLVYTLLFLNSDFMNYINIIPVYVFYHCTFLTSVTIPNSVEEIRRSAFKDCTSLTSITIPNSVTKIGDYAFYKCTSLKAISIPNSVAKIGWGVFSGCTSLTSVTIPSSVKEIGEYAFFNCASLQAITIPNSVKEIGYDAFRVCSSLKTFTCSKDLKFDAEKIGLNADVEVIRV